MSIEKLHAVLYVLFSILIGVGAVYVTSKYFYSKLLEKIEVCDLYVLNLGNKNDVIYTIKIGELNGMPVRLSRAHQTSSFWLPFFALVAEFDPEKMNAGPAKTMLIKRYKGMKLFLIDDLKGHLKTYTQKEPA